MNRIGAVFAGLLVAVSTAAAAQDYTFECPYKVEGLPQGRMLNVRQGPGLHFRKIGELPPGRSGLIIDKCQKDWCRIPFDGGKGWVKMMYMAAYCS